MTEVAEEVIIEEGGRSALPVNEYVFLKENGTVASTLKTTGPIQESETVLKVENSDQYAGKKVVNGEITSIPCPILSLHQFRSRFTTAEKVGIKTSTDPVVQVFLDDMAAASKIDLALQELIDGMTYLVDQGLITEARKAEILTISTGA